MPASNKLFDAERLRKYSTAELAEISGLPVRTINAAKQTGSVRRKTWHLLVQAMRKLKPSEKAPPVRDKRGRFTTD